jgi:hypothetical protein
MITNRFSPDRPVSCSQGRNGELIVVQGGGVRPARVYGTSAAVDAGMDAPTTAPAVTAITPACYYIARADVYKSGSCYYAPPPITFTSEKGRDPVLGKEAKAQAFLGQSSLSEVRIDDGGKYYLDQPSVELGDTYGKGAELTATLDGAPTAPNGGDPYTGITEWKIVQAPDYLDAAGIDDGLTWYYGAGSATVPAASSTADFGLNFGVPAGGKWDGLINCSTIGTKKGFSYSVSGGTGSGATVKLTFGDATFSCSNTGSLGGTAFIVRGARQLVSAEAWNYGAKYGDGDTVVLRIPSGSGNASRDIILHGITSGNPQNTTAQRFGVRAIAVTKKGSGFLVAPQLKITSPSGFGAYATCTVKNGSIDTVTLENGGGGYKKSPVVEVLAGGAEVFAVSRPHLRGKYQCYLRYVDNTPEDRGGPIPSNLSPVLEVDAGEGAKSLSWVVPQPTGRAVACELWRTTSNQATTLYRVATLTAANAAFVDDLTDDEIRDPDRAGYSAMPIVLPNGQINANRFGVPPLDKSAVVRFQDRYWYGVDTSGKQPNTIMYSEVDEPESVPDINELILQQNERDSDAVTAMIPYGPTMLIMQSRACYTLTFAKQPVLDAQVTPVAYRGALNQRCWDVLDGVAYVLDQYGVYAISLGGSVEPLSRAIDDIFNQQMDRANCRWYFLSSDPASRILRVFIALKGDGSGGYPTRAYCYHVDSKTWWQERYPQRLSSACPARMSNGDYQTVYAGTGGTYLLGEGSADLARGAVIQTVLTSGGAGYSKPPVVTATGGSGAEFQASIDLNGKVTAIWITSMGYGYTNGTLYISPPDSGTSRAAATYVATSLTTDTPVYTPYRFKTGAMRYVSDSQDPKAASTTARNVSLQYRPQPTSCEVAMRLYYNNSPNPRPNAAARDRGVGFKSNTVDSGGRLDMAANMTKYGADTGVARALLSGRTMDDIASADRAIAVELAGARKTSDPVVIYSLDANGTET